VFQQLRFVLGRFLKHVTNTLARRHHNKDGRCLNIDLMHNGPPPYVIPVVCLSDKAKPQHELMPYVVDDNLGLNGLEKIVLVHLGKGSVAAEESLCDGSRTRPLGIWDFELLEVQIRRLV